MDTYSHHDKPKDEYDTYVRMTMASQNLLNRLCSEHPHIVQTLIRKNGTGDGKNATTDLV